MLLNSFPKIVFCESFLSLKQGCFFLKFGLNAFPKKIPETKKQLYI